MTDNLSKAFKDVMNERARQVKIGHSLERDDQYPRGELGLAGAAYAGVAAGVAASSTTLTRAAMSLYPWKFFSPSNDYRTNMVRAAALMVADIEAFDRAEARKAGA